MCFLSERARKHLPWVLLVGLAVRLVFVWFFPAESGDTSLYKQLAYNWLDHGIYGLTINGQVIPADLRVPGYPAFLAIVSLVFGRSQMAILLAQTFLDLGTCLLTALLAAALVPREWSERVTIPALWLAATCPFVANYCAVPLTEVLATCLTTAAFLCLVKAARTTESSEVTLERPRARTISWLFAGILTGLCTLIRPESPLLLVAAGIALLLHWCRRADWSKLVRAGVLLAAGFLVPLLPWAARNWITLHRVQFLATRYAELTGEFVPRGYYAWTKTWLWRYRDAYTAVWAFDDGEPIAIDGLPPSAMDTPNERSRVAAALEAYNAAGSATPEIDAVFAQLAAERTARHPLRTYLILPLRRAFAIWFTPRVEMLPLSGHLTPIYKEWDEDRLDFCVTLAFGFLNLCYIILAFFGIRSALRRRTLLRPGLALGLALLLSYLLVRTAFLTYLETPEPRYVVVCFPAVLALAALVWFRPARNLPA